MAAPPGRPVAVVTARRRPVEPTTPPADRPDVVTAIEITLGVLDGRPFSELLRGITNGAPVIAGFAILAGILGRAVNPTVDAQRAALRQLQAAERLWDVFEVPEP